VLLTAVFSSCLFHGTIAVSTSHFPCAAGPPWWPPQPDRLASLNSKLLFCRPLLIRHKHRDNVQAALTDAMMHVLNLQSSITAVVLISMDGQ